MDARIHPVGTSNTDRVVDDHLALEKSEWARTVEATRTVPVEPSLWPSVYWIACIVETETEVTDREVEQVASYIDYAITNVYGGGFAARVRARKLPVAAGHNTVILVKHPEVPEHGRSWSGWGYRRMSFQTGSWPHSYQGRRDELLPDHALTLVELLDQVCGLGAYDRVIGGPSSPNPKWEAWKAAHPEVFS